MTSPMECSGCGSREDLDVIQARGHISCCPERKMVPILTPDGVIKERGEGRTLSPEVEARVRAGRSRDGWEAWAPTDSHVLRIALRLDGEAAALLEAFSISGPWYANAISPDGERHRLGAGISLAGAVQWCEVTTGYVMAPASTVQSPSSQESGVGETEGWRSMDSAPKDGTIILISRSQSSCFEDWWHAARWEDDWWQIHDGKVDHPLRGQEPSHWMALPAPPAAPRPSQREG